MSNAREEPRDGALWRRLFAVQANERALVGLAALAFFCVLFGIFLLRPVRDEMGLRGGVRNLKYLWTVTLGGTLAASFAFAALASRWPRRAFMASTFRAVGLIWLAFLPAVVWGQGPLALWFGRAFYVVHAVTNVLLVSLFWAQIADVFDLKQARRLFGLIAVGGTLGAIAGTAVTGWVARTGLATWLLIPAALVLEASVQLSRQLAGRVASSQEADGATGASARAAALPLGGDAFEGLKLVASSRYLLGIAVFTFLLGVVQTFLTFEQNHIVDGAIPAADVEARQAYFAWTENAAQSLTLIVQLFVTGALMRKIGVGGTLLVLPLVGALGFVALGFGHLGHANTLALVTVAMVAWRGLNHATLRPAREALYVPLSRGEKFKAKSFTDTFAFRGGDLASAWSFDAFTLTSAAFVAAPLAGAWALLGLWLGHRQRRLAQRSH